MDLGGRAGQIGGAFGGRAGEAVRALRSKGGGGAMKGGVGERGRELKSKAGEIVGALEGRVGEEENQLKGGAGESGGAVEGGAGEGVGVEALKGRAGEEGRILNGRAGEKGRPLRAREEGARALKSRWFLSRPNRVARGGTTPKPWKTVCAPLQGPLSGWGNLAHIAGLILLRNSSTVSNLSVVSRTRTPALRLAESHGVPV